jgi:hypothetical protein
MARMTIGLANQSSTVDDEQLKRVAAALDTQVKRDLKPIWEVDADVVALGSVRTIPHGISPIIILDHTPHDFAGVHTITQGVPWAMVSTKRDWALAASHECLEMLVDPSGEATRSSIGLALLDGTLHETEERFDYLLEACDPIEDADHAYEIGGVLVSDFYTPHFFDDAAAPGVRYSFNGALTRPREVGRNGYLSWRDPATAKLRQLRNFDGFSIVDLPERGQDAVSTRMFVDRNTPTPRTHPHLFRH